MGFQEKAAVELVDGSVFVGKLLGSVEVKCSDNEVVEICCKEIFAIKTKRRNKMADEKEKKKAIVKARGCLIFCSA